MTEQTFASRYILFAGDSPRDGEDLRGPYVTVTSQRNQLPCRLDPQEYALAQLFDGKNSAAQRLEQAQQRFNPELNSVDMHRFSTMLTDAGLLWAGADEPLPVPAQTDAETARLGDLGHEQGHDEGLPPSTSPGSLSSPGLTGPLAGSPMRARDAGERIDWLLNPSAWLWLGRLFASPVYSRVGQILLWIAAIMILAALWNDRLAATTDFQRLLYWKNLAFVGIPAALLSNFLSHIARVAVIHKESGEFPRFGLNLVFGFLPRFMSDTEGPAERLDHAGRGRVLASSLSANLLLFSLLLLGWFISRQGTTMLPAVLITAGMFALGNAVLRLNPLARTDGYYLLAFKVGIADLREQATLALLRRHDRWGNRQAPPAGPLILYGLLALGWLLAIIILILVFPARWLEAQYGGASMALLAGGILLFILHLRRQFADQRGDIGNLPLRSRLSRQARSSAKHWQWYVVFCVAALWPYTYEPGGRFEILPLNKADISSETAGQVAKVMAREGDQLQAGDLVVQLDDLQWVSQVKQAQANVARIEADLSKARNGATDEELELAKQQVQTARARLNASQTESRRAEDAHRRRAITSQERDRAVEGTKVREQELIEAQRQLELIQSDTREENIAALEAQLASEKAQLDFAREQQQRSRIRAPISGTVVGENLRFARGRYLDAGEVVGRIENLSQLEAEMRLPEFAARYAQPGAKATMKTWMRPTAAYHGTVKSIAPTAENGENGRILRVLITIDDADDTLLTQMSGQAKLQAETGPAIVAFSRAVVRFITVELWSWLP